MPFGLKTAPGTFQWAFDVITSTVSWKHALVYLDYLFFSSKSGADHIGHITSDLSLIQEAGVTLKPKKVSSFQ